MAERGWGRVLMIGSSVVSAPMSGFALSNVLRKGLVGFSESITQEFAAKGVTANLLNPGITRTARLERLIKLKAENLGVSEAEIEAQFLHSVPVNRFGNPKELASLATFLASEEAAFITGQSINVDGGQSVFG
jgi:3-oxoacyl-[acyl-carrier protein] reductase